MAFETIEDKNGGLPCLRPMSEIAGRLSIQEGAKYLERAYGGRGILLGGVPGVERGKVVIIGGGIAGTNAAKMAVGLGAQVTVIDISLDRLGYLDDIFGGSITTLKSSDGNIDRTISEADLVVGSVLIPGASAPKLIKRKHLGMMKPGAVPRTSTLALVNTTMSYGLQIANMGIEKACSVNPGLAKGVNTYCGECTYKEVAENLGLPYKPLELIID